MIDLRMATASERTPLGNQGDGDEFPLSASFIRLQSGRRRQGIASVVGPYVFGRSKIEGEECSAR
jgi:hypothetical protein